MQDRQYLFLDIETIPTIPEKRLWTKPETPRPTYDNFTFKVVKPELQERDLKEAQAKWDKDMVDWVLGVNAALDPLTGSVAMVGMKMNDEYYQPDYIGNGREESDLLTWVWERIETNYHRCATKLVGHDILRFDLPFLLKRSLINGVKFPRFIADDLLKYKPDAIIDTHRLLQFGDRQARIGLKKFAPAMGWETYQGPVTGEDFFRHFLGVGGVEKNVSECIEYNKTDVLLCEKVLYLYNDLLAI